MFLQYGSKTLLLSLLTVTLQLVSVNKDMKTSEPKYNTLLLSLNLAVAFFSVSSYSRCKVYRLAALHETGS